MNEFVHYATISAIVTLPALGVGIGQGKVNRATITAIDEQPATDAALRQMSLISMTLSETAVLLGVVMAFLMLNDSTSQYSALGYAGILFSVGLPGFMVGLASSLAGRAAMAATARQPFFASKIMQLLLISQTIIQTPAIFGFIIGLIIRNQMLAASLMPIDGIRLCASGLGFGLSCIGPLIGLGMFAQRALTAVGLHKELYSQIRTFSFVSQALIDAPIVFALVIGLTMSALRGAAYASFGGMHYISAALCIGLSTLGAGISSGRTAASAVTHMVHNPVMSSVISRMSIISQTFIDTSAIYGTLLALLILLS